MTTLNHIVYVRDSLEGSDDFVKKLAHEGFTYDQMVPDKNLLNKVESLSPVAILLDADLEERLLNDLIQQFKKQSPYIPVLLVSALSEVNKENIGPLPAADSVLFKNMHATHLSMVLRGMTRSFFSIQELIHSNRKLNEISITDALTGLHNRGYMMDRLNLEFKRAGRNRETLSCLMIDLDHFKQVNDTYGHKFGDIVLQNVSNRLSQLIREIDIFGRYGGEEFLLILPNTSLDGAGYLAEKLRGGLEEERITHEYFSLLMTASFGVASTENTEVITADHLLQLSDRALYRAKESGRNRIALAGYGDAMEIGREMPGSERRSRTRDEQVVDVISANPEACPYVDLLRKSSEYHLVLHHSSEEFLTAFKEREPQLLMIDQVGGKIDGVDLCKRFKAQIQDLFIPVLMLLDKSNHAEADEALAGGVDEVIWGNLDQRDFLSRLKTITSLKNLHDRWRGTYQDLTMTRTRLVKVERLTALGEMATGVAHDFNNVLSTVLGRTQLLRQRVKDPEILKNLKVIEKAAGDGATTIRRIQEFSRSTTDHVYEGLDMVQVINDCIQMTRTRWKDEAEMMGITYRFDTNFPDRLPVIGSPAELREVITNLIMNALDAMPKGGEMRFEGVVHNKEVTLTIQDKGEGMDEEVQKRVFDPFFSTKEGKGTGLGLSVAYGIIARHNGRIECSSVKDEGTVFRIQLPHHEFAPTEPQATPEKDEEAVEKTLRVLVVDDEAPIREIFEDVLSEEGHEVLLAESGEAAVEILKEKKIDLLFTDLSMPGMSGWDVARHVHKKFPKTVIILTSGWGSDFNQERLAKHGVNLVLPKPVPFKSLQTLIHQVALGQSINISKVS